MLPVVVAPSILSADPLNFAGELKSTEAGGADWHHIDVMDGHFVPNLTFGLPLIKAIKRVSTIPLDVHIMVDNPEAVAAEYILAGADILSFHAEAARHPHRLVQAIKSQGAKAGIALNPGSPVSLLEPLIADADVILIMSVNPGFGGQSFIPATIDRIKEVRKMAEKYQRSDDLILEVDGGITGNNCRSVRNAGANAFVAGSFVYNATNREEAILQLKS